MLRRSRARYGSWRLISGRTRASPYRGARRTRDIAFVPVGTLSSSTPSARGAPARTTRTPCAAPAESAASPNRPRRTPRRASSPGRRSATPSRRRPREARRSTEATNPRHATAAPYPGRRQTVARLESSTDSTSHSTAARSRARSRGIARNRPLGREIASGDRHDFFALGRNGPSLSDFSPAVRQRRAQGSARQAKSRGSVGGRLDGRAGLGDRGARALLGEDHELVGQEPIGVAIGGEDLCGAARAELHRGA